MADTLDARPLRVRILEQGARLTYGERNVQYGEPRFNLELSGQLKNLVRQHQRANLSSGEMEALDNVLQKIARIYTGGYNPDNYVDGATYFAIAGELAQFAQNREEALLKERQIVAQPGDISPAEMAQRLAGSGADAP